MEHDILATTQLHLPVKHSRVEVLPQYIICSTLSGSAETSSDNNTENNLLSSFVTHPYAKGSDAAGDAPDINDYHSLIVCMRVK